MTAVRLALVGLVAGAAPLLGQRPRDWSQADRTVIGNFSDIRTVASGTDRVYVVGPLGVMALRSLEQRWEGPFTPPDPALLARAILSMVDPLDQSIWIVAATGWLNYQPDLQLWSGGTIPANVRGIAVDEADPSGGLRINTNRGWYRAVSGASVATPALAPLQPVFPATVQDALRANPSLQSNATLILRDPRGNAAQFTSAAPSPDRMGWYLGTSGAGLVFYRAGDIQPQRIAFGLSGDRVGALYASGDGVWVATDRTATTDAAVTYLSADLMTSNTQAGGGAMGLGYSQVRRMTAMQKSLYLATDAGVTQLEVATGRTRFYGASGALLDPRSNAVAGRRGRVLVGTARGLAAITDSATVVRLAQDFFDPVLALETEGDSIWLGTQSGLLVVLPDQRLPGRTPGLANSASFRAPVVAIAWLADTLVALTTDQLLWRMPGTDDWTLGPILSGILGRLRDFAAYDDGFFVAGERGLAYVGLRTPPQRPLLGAEHPGLIRDIAVTDEYLWEATDGGLVRWRVEAILP